MALKVKTVANSAEKWQDNAARAADRFATEAAASADIWASNTAAAADNGSCCFNDVACMITICKIFCYNGY